MGNYNTAIRLLDGKRLVRGAFVEGGGIEDVKITDFGRCYMAENPNLRNPINWGMVGAVASVITAIGAVIALLVGCSIVR